ncbi:MAG: hypothetical protein J5J00_17415 [Deltaproteobacteria bacterium]|nr:hypothetical protein [Deltaproteobacteria bacterium]
MYHSDFDPYGRPKREFKLFPEKKENPLIVGVQLFVIFLVVRLCMLAGGVIFVRIPYIDDLLVQLVAMITRFG